MLTPDEIIGDYRIAFRSRQVSTLAVGEVMLGRAMFGIFGDGKEVAQVAMARAFRAGDMRSTRSDPNSFRPGTSCNPTSSSRGVSGEAGWS